MKTTIKKMIRFGLKKEDIKAEFGLNEEQFNRYDRQGRGLEVKNLPELLEKYNTNKYIDNTDREKADMFDKLFRLEDKEVPNLTTEQKSGLLAAFPYYIQNLQKEIAEKEIEKLEEQIITIKEQINKVCLENGLAVKYPTEVKEEQEDDKKIFDGKKYNVFGELVSEPISRISEFRYGEGIRVQSPHYKLGADNLLLSVQRKFIDNLHEGDTLVILDDNSKYVYTIVKVTIKPRASYIKVVKKQG